MGFLYLLNIMKSPVGNEYSIQCAVKECLQGNEDYGLKAGFIQSTVALMTQYIIWYNYSNIEGNKDNQGLWRMIENICTDFMYKVSMYKFLQQMCCLTPL